MSATTPWGNRPIPFKMYGPRAFNLGVGTTTVPSFLEITFPAWTHRLNIGYSTSTSIVRWGSGIRSNFKPDGLIASTNDGLFALPQVSGGIQINESTMITAPVRNLIVFNFGAAISFFVYALLSPVAPNQMPSVEADVGAWATYNNEGNNPT